MILHDFASLEGLNQKTGGFIMTDSDGPLRIVRCRSAEDPDGELLLPLKEAKRPKKGKSPAGSPPQRFETDWNVLVTAPVMLSLTFRT